MLVPHVHGFAVLYHRGLSVFFDGTVSRNQYTVRYTLPAISSPSRGERGHTTTKNQGKSQSSSVVLSFSE